MEDHKCPGCGNMSPAQAKYCSWCGAALTTPAAPPERRFLGDYELMAYDNEPEEPELPPDHEIIIDRDAVPFPRARTRPRAGLVHLLLIALLVTLGIGAYAGVGIMAQRREVKAQEQARVLKLQQAAEAKAARDAYGRVWREFLILAQAQGESFQLNLTAWQNLEESRWMTDIFLGGLFAARIKRFQSSAEFTAMVNRQAKLRDQLSKLAEPPQGMAKLLTAAEELEKASRGIHDLFAGELAEGQAEETAQLLDRYTGLLAKAPELNDTE